MAKTAKVKKREVSMHSRAARRNATPPPKDLAVKVAPVEESDYKPWLHGAQNAGISKRKKTKSLTRQQRLRQQKGIERGEEVVEKLEKKVEDSKKRSKRIQSRAVDWEELNEKLEGKKKADADKKLKSKKVDGGEVPTGEEQEMPAQPAEMEGVEEEDTTEFVTAIEEQEQDAGAEEPEDDVVL